jgi:L-asparaginase II
VLVDVHRGDVLESRHRGHIVQVSPAGHVQRVVGDPETIVTLRSTVKPFALVALVEAGAADDLRLSDEELALLAASHLGEDKHVRTLQALFRRAGISQSILACGAEGMPRDPRTAARLARDGETPGPLRHMCSGFHAASVLLSRFAGWPLETYVEPSHQSQVAVRETVSRLFGTTSARLETSVDDCGLLTYAFPLVHVARAYALLADPERVATDPERARSVQALIRIRDAMMAAPDMVGGTSGSLDTELMRRRPGLLVSKGGAEGLRGIGLRPGSRRGREEAEPVGLAVRIEDGDGFRRANRAVCVEALAQLGVLDDRDMRALSPFHRPITRAPSGEVISTASPHFDLAPLAELV